MLFLQITGETVGEVRAVSHMHERKAEMARQADAFIALPGIYLYIYDPWIRILNVELCSNMSLDSLDIFVNSPFINVRWVWDP